MIIDPTQIICDSFKKILDSAFSKFKYYADKIEREYDRISDQIDLLNDQISEPIEEIQNSINEKNNEFNSKLDEMNNLAASVPLLCLDGIFNNIKEFSNNISTGVNNLLSDITPEVDVLGLMTQFTGNLQKYDITSLIESLDVSLGCLNDQNCLPIEEIDYYNNYINNFISKVGLSESGDFDWETYINNFNISDNIKNNLNSLKDTVNNSLNNLSSSVDTSLKTISSIKKPNISINNDLI